MIRGRADRPAQNARGRRGTRAWPSSLSRLAVRVVHHEEGNPIGGAKITRAYQLAIALEIREADQIWSQNLYEPRWTSAVMHVGPARLAYSRHVDVAN